MESSAMQTDVPYVAVFMVTYNHERYIGQAIEGVLMQRTDFKVRLYIGEDCSTDNTRNICRDYERKYPDAITLICTAQNNLFENVANIWKATLNSGAKYIAMCEGDDYWTDPYKLQKQVGFLDANPDFTICFSNVAIEDELGLGREDDAYFPALSKEVYTIEDFILSGMNIIPTPTMLFRNILPYPLPDYYVDAKVGDMGLQILLADKGKAKLFVEKMAVYRNHSGGITKSKEKLWKGEDGLMQFYKKYNEVTGYKYNAIFRKRFLMHAQVRLIFGATGKKGLARIRHYFEKMPPYIKYSDKINLKELVYYHLILISPSFFKKKQP